jgi:hypothetical protein
VHHMIQQLKFGISVNYLKKINTSTSSQTLYTIQLKRAAKNKLKPTSNFMQTTQEVIKAQTNTYLLLTEL